MNEKIHLQPLLSGPDKTPAQQLALFAWLNLGILESLANGLIKATDAVRTFFNAENALFVQQNLTDQIAGEIMSHGVQLADLFEVLPAEEAQMEFQRELATIRALCLSLLKEKSLAA